MNSKYQIIKCNSDNYECIVIPTATTNPLEDIKALITELNQENIKSGDIVFDFIFSEGNTKERYACVQYNNGFVRNSFRHIDVPLDNPIRKKSSDYLRGEINKGVFLMLRKSQISLLKKGYTI